MKVYIKKLDNVINNVYSCTPGAVHHDDLIYLFYISRMFPEFNETDPEIRLVNTLTSTWTEFASTG